MASTAERRHAPRLQLDPALPGELAHTAVTVMDLSMTGARLQHDTPLMYSKGKRFGLDVVWNGEHLRLTCTVVRVRMETHPVTRRIVYTSGVQFLEVDEEQLARICLALASPVATARGIATAAQHDQSM